MDTMDTFLKIVKQMIADGQVAQDVAEKYFPELAESEDEKIRKTLIEIFSSIGKKDWRDIPTEKIIAWLEKQGKKPQGKSALEAINEVKMDNSNSVNGVPFDCERATITQKDVAEKIRKWLIGYFKQYKDDGMEKYSNGLKVDDILAWLEKWKSTDKVEPKFKVGDWIVIE